MRRGLLHVLGRLFSGALGRDERPRSKHPLLAVFGKHPSLGKEHMESGLGPGIDECADIKLLIYNQWLPEILPLAGATPVEYRLLGFDHIFIAPRERGAVLGRIVSRGDAAGRMSYPLLVLCWLPCEIESIAAGITFGAINSLVDALDALSGTSDLDHAARAVVESQSRLVQAFDRLSADQSAYGASSAKNSASIQCRFPSGLHQVRVSVEVTGAVERLVFSVASYASGFTAGSPRLSLVLAPLKHRWVDLIFDGAKPQDLLCFVLTDAALPPKRIETWLQLEHGQALDDATER